MHMLCRAVVFAGGLLLSVFVGNAMSATVSPGQPTRMPVVADTSDRSDQEPYATDRSVGYHLLALPSYVLHGATRPLGWGIEYISRNYPSLFEGQLPPRFILPLVELGGPTGFQAGVLAYDNQLFGSAHSVRLRTLYGGPNTFQTQLTYDSPRVFQLQVNAFSNPESGFFLGGNDSDKNRDDASADRDQVDVTVGIQGMIVEGLNTSFDLLYEHVETQGRDDATGQRLDRANPPGLGTADLLTSRFTLRTGRTKRELRTGGARRTYRRYLGTEVILQLDYTHDLIGERFRYGRYALDVRQYLPIGILPKSRRIVLKGHLEQVKPIFGGAAVPFYQLPTLGGQNTLRGFTSSRFQADGALAGSVEYRYPIWSNLDALFLVDAGQVFDSFEEVAADRFHWSYGGGLHLLAGSGLGFRLELAHSPEGVRTILTVAPSFQRSAR